MALRLSPRTRGWLELLQLPDLFTVPGDVLAGALLAGAGAGSLPALVLLVGASLLMYAAGLLFNDYSDRDSDARERPERPIPSGRVSASSVRKTAAALFAASLLLAALGAAVSHRPYVFVAAVLLAALVVLYAAAARRAPAAGFFVAGLCRGVNVLLGAAVASFTSAALTGAALETAYIAAVTALAYDEARLIPARPLRYLPVVILLPLLVFSRGDMGGLLAAFMVVLIAFFATRSMEQDMRTMPQHIGRLVRLLILVQFCFAVITAPGTPLGLPVAAALLALYVGARYAVHHYYGS